MSDYFTLKVWNAATGECLRTLPVPRARGFKIETRCAVSPDGTWIVTGGNDCKLWLWDAAGVQQPRTLSGHTSRVASCAVSPSGAWLVSASSDGTLKVWNAASGRQ